jgi:hypothetical protein
MREALMIRVLALAERFGHLGLQHDLACLTLAELWGVCHYLQRLADG